MRVYLHSLNEVEKAYCSAGIFVHTKRSRKGILKCMYICTHCTKLRRHIEMRVYLYALNEVEKAY